MDTKAPVTTLIEENEAWDKSPFIQGLLAAAKGALIGGPAAGFVQSLRGKSPAIGGALGALSVGLLAGLAKATQQDLANQADEASLRYHADRLKAREPLFFMPPPNHLGPLFSRLHQREHTSVRPKS